MGNDSLHLIVFLSLVVVFCCAHDLRGDDTASTPQIANEDLPLGARGKGTPVPGETEFGGGAWLWRTVGALAVVAGLIVVMRVVLQRARGAGVTGGKSMVRVLHRTTIAPRVQILFLQVNQKIIVASQTSQGALCTLAILDDPKDLDWALSCTGATPYPDRHGDAPSSARDRLAGLMGRLREAKNGGRP